MSDFVKNVVKQVLARNETPATTVNRSEVRQSSARQVGTIERPNYQRIKQDRRLSPLKQTAVTSSMREAVNKNSRTVPVHQASQLQRLSLAHGSQALSSVPTNRSMSPSLKNEHVPEATLIGRTRDETYVWFFPRIHQQLQRYFRSGDNGKAIGMITASQCFPGQLFFIEALLREYPGMSHHIEWDKTSSRPFLCELSSDNANDLFRLLKDIYQQLNRRALRGVDGYTSIAPSAWLLQQLAVDRSVRAVGVLEGIVRANSIGLLNNFLRQNTDLNISFQIEDNYVLLFGEGELVSETITALKQQLNEWLRT